MAKVLSLKQALKVWLWTIVAVVAVVASGKISDALARADHPSPLMRWLAVAFAACSPVPLVGIVVWGYGVCDEFQRQIVLVGTALAFVLYILLYTAFVTSIDVGLVAPDEYIPYLPAAALIWLLGVGLTAVYYRLRP